MVFAPALIAALFVYCGFVKWCRDVILSGRAVGGSFGSITNCVACFVLAPFAKNHGYICLLLLFGFSLVQIVCIDWECSLMSLGL